MFSSQKLSISHRGNSLFLLSLLFILLLPSLLFAQRKSAIDIIEVDRDYATYDEQYEQAGDHVIIFQQDFENTSLGVYDVDEFRRDWIKVSYANRLSKTYIEEKDGSNVLKWIFPEGTWGLSEERGGGGQFLVSIPGFHEELYFSYNVMFKPGFEYVLSGKLPGFEGGDTKYPPGEKPAWDQGFYCGGAWQGKHNPRGYNCFYTYHQDQNGDYGDLHKWLDPYNENERYYLFKEDNVNEKWVNVTTRIALNTVNDDGSGGNKDGLLEGYIDGKLMYQIKGLRFRNLSSISIDKMVIVSFFGGNSEYHASVRDEWALFDDFYLFKYADGVNVPRGNTYSSPGRVLDLPNFKGESQTLDRDEFPPTVPSGLRVSGSSENSVSLAWNASSDNVAVAGYRVYMDGVLEDATTGTSYTVSGLSKGTDYLFSVSAFDAESNESSQSDPVSFSTQDVDTEAPTIPVGITLTGLTGNSISLSWSKSFDNIAVAGYRIFVDGPMVGTSVNNTYAVTGLTPKTKYTITVSSFDAVQNESAQSESLQVTTEGPDEEAPTVPTGLVAVSIAGKSISLVWNSSSDNVAVSGYRVIANGLRRGTAFSNSYTITQLNPGIEYLISVTAYDAAGNESTASDQISIRTNNPDVTVEPTLPEIAIVEVENTENSVQAVSELKSFGYTELEDYGMLISQDNEKMLSGNVVYGLPDATLVKNEKRVTEGLEVMYNFSEGIGTVIPDITQSGASVDLHVDRVLNTIWLPGQGLKVTDNTIISSSEPPSGLINAITQTGEISIEAWIKSTKVDQSGPARIITLSLDNSERAFTLGQIGNTTFNDYAVRFNSSSSDTNGLPEIATDENFVNPGLHHVVYTRSSNGTEKLFVNGIENYSGMREGDLSSWGSGYQLALANELTGERPWYGTYYLVAIYSRALEPKEISTNYQAGFGNVLFTSNLENLEPNVTYYISPFVRTDQGVVYGDVQSLMIENVRIQNKIEEQKDTLLMAVFPNPTPGNFMVEFEDRGEKSNSAIIHIADQSGHIIFIKEVELPEGTYSGEKRLDLTGILKSSGFYSVIVIMGLKSAARKLIILR